jgi:5-formyltetrahydrofolate cyclo-ligase
MSDIKAARRAAAFARRAEAFAAGQGQAAEILADFLAGRRGRSVGLHADADRD